VAVRIAAFVIDQVVTLAGGNISRVNGSGLCSRVLGTLNCPTPLTALPVNPGQPITGGRESAVITSEEICRWVTCPPTPRPAGSLILADEGPVPQRPTATIRQQFLFALLEDCGFFAHLVLRCVRGGDGSLHSVKSPRTVKSRPAEGILRVTRPVTHTCAQRERQNLSAGTRETSLPELETLWADVARRQMGIPICQGERP
jgi:hypothetical protein